VGTSERDTRTRGLIYHPVGRRLAGNRGGGSTAEGWSGAEMCRLRPAPLSLFCAKDRSRLDLGVVLETRVQGSGFRVQGSGFRVQKTRVEPSVAFVCQNIWLRLTLGHWGKSPVVAALSSCLSSIITGVSSEESEGYGPGHEGTFGVRLVEMRSA
jgi:hypothetical protein